VEPEQVRDWLCAQDLRPEDFGRMMTDAALTEWYRRVKEEEIQSLLPDELRLAGAYETIASRARHKLQQLHARRQWHVSLADARISEEELQLWSASQALLSDVADVRKRTARPGLANEGSFRRALLREYMYRQAMEADHGAGEAVQDETFSQPRGRASGSMPRSPARS
jgi:hypothetical protein